MGFSLGELFIALGFDVDDQKLKTFKKDLRDTHEEMVKLGTVAGGTVATLALFVQNASNSAVKLSNMASLWGANTQAAQTFANALHQVNNQISISAGQEKYRAFAEMINAKVPVGSGSAAALSLLGVTNPYASPEEVLGEIRKNLPGRMASFGTSPEKQHARASDLLSQIGLGDSLNALLEPDAQYQTAGKYNIQQGVIDNLSKYVKATAEFDEALNKFSTDMAGEIGPKMAKTVEWLTKTLNYLDNFNTQHPGAATAEGVTGAAVGTIGVVSFIRNLFGGSGVGTAASSSLRTMGALGGAAAIGEGAWWLTGKEVEGAQAFAKWWHGGGAGTASPSWGASFTKDQRMGIMRALYDESRLSPNSVGDSGLAYGIAQWHPDRQANFRRWAGHDIRGSSRQEQLEFVNYELTQGMERSAGDKIAHAQNEDEAYQMAKKYYERPAGSDKIQITNNIHSNAKDNQEVANLVNRHVENLITGAYAQTNQGPQ